MVSLLTICSKMESIPVKTIHLLEDRDFDEFQRVDSVADD